MSRRDSSPGLLVVAVALGTFASASSWQHLASAQQTSPPIPPAEPPGDAKAPDPKQPKETPDEGKPVEKARDLARESLADLEAKRYDQALEKARAAEALYHAPIHLRVVGEALEGLGRRAEAAEIYERLAAEPLPETAHPLFLEARDFARERLKELIAVLPSLLVEVTGVDVDTVEVTVGGRSVVVNGEVAVRFDPGEYVLEVKAPDRRTIRQTIELREGAGVVKVQVPMRRESEPEEAVTVEETGPVDTSSGLAVPGWVLVGIGGASLVAGAVTGGLTLAQAGDLESRCPDRRCTVADQSDYDSTVTLGWVSTVTLGVGAALVATGGLLLILDGTDEEADTLEVRLGPSSGSLLYRF